MASPSCFFEIRGRGERTVNKPHLCEPNPRFRPCLVGVGRKHHNGKIGDVCIITNVCDSVPDVISALIIEGK